jgi:multidrug efflux system membrane fusion protein
MTRTRRSITVLLCLSLVGGAVGYWYWTGPQSQQQQQKGGGFRKKALALNPDDIVPVLAATAKLEDVPVYIDGVGTGRALNTVTVRPQVDGKLIKVSFTEGMDVPKDYVLGKIDPTTYQAAYDQAMAKKAQDQATLANARLDLDRYTRLATTNAVNKQQVDTQRATVAQLEAQVNSDQAAIDNARAILSYTDITAPMAGRTGIRMIDEGNLVRSADATTALVVITQLQPISVFFSLPQQELPNLNRGLSAGPLPVQALSADGKTTLDAGKVLVIDNQVDQTTGTVKLKAEFPNANLQLWPGQFVNIKVLINTLSQVVVVPTAAVQRGPNGTFVYIVKPDNTVTVRQIAVRQQNDLEAVIARGLEASEKVVTTGFARLAEGTKVEVSSAEEAGQVSPNGERPRRDGARGKGNGKGNAKGKAGTPVSRATPPAGGAVQTSSDTQPSGAQTTGGSPSVTQ